MRLSSRTMDRGGCVTMGFPHHVFDSAMHSRQNAMLSFDSSGRHVQPMSKLDHLCGLGMHQVPHEQPLARPPMRQQDLLVPPDMNSPALSEVSLYWMQRMIQELAKQQTNQQAASRDNRTSHEIMCALSALPPPPGLEPRRAVAQDRPLNFSEDENIDADASSNNEPSHDDESSIDGDARLDQLIATLSARSAQTTLMIRNVPVLYTREMLLAEWPNDGTYDFLYLPYSCSMQRNLSYAFVNFTSESAALAFVQQWQKKRLMHYTSRKPLNISFADVQGLDSNLWQLKKKRVKRIKINQCQPMIFELGHRVPLAEALKALEERTMAIPLLGEVISL